MASTVSDLHLLTQLRGKKRTYRLHSKGRLAGIVHKIKTSAKSRAFASLLESSASSQGIFLNHWKQVSVLADFSLPLFFASQQNEPPLGAFGRSGVEGEAELNLTVERILEQAKPRLEETLKRFVARLKAQGVDLEQASEGVVMKALFDLFGGLSGGSPTKAFITLLRPYEDFFADEIPDVASLILDSIKAGILSSGFSRRQTVLQSSGLGLTDYEAEIAKLAASGYLLPALSVMWCNEHGQYPRSFVITGHKSLPTGSKCDLCRRPLRSGTFYVPCSPAMTVARQYQGPMLPLMAWDLERNEIPWNAEVFLEGENDTEKDLVFRWTKSQKVSIVEVKSYYRDTNDRVRIDNLSGLVRQMEQHVASYESRGIRVEQALLATNYPTTGALEKHVETFIAETKGLELLRNISVRLIGPGSLTNWWRN